MYITTYLYYYLHLTTPTTMGYMKFYEHGSSIASILNRDLEGRGLEFAITTAVKLDWLKLYKYKITKYIR